MNKCTEEVQQVRAELRKIADEVWSVAKETDDRESASRLKSLSSRLHHEASKLGG